MDIRTLYSKLDLPNALYLIRAEVSVYRLYRSVSVSTVLFFLLLFFADLAMATKQCSFIFKAPPNVDSEVQLNPPPTSHFDLSLELQSALHADPVRFLQFDEAKIAIGKLIKENKDLFANSRTQPEFSKLSQINVLDVKLETLHPNYPTFLAFIEPRNKKQSPLRLRIRTNGKVFFLDRTYHHNQANTSRSRIQFVYKNEFGEFILSDFTSMVLQTLPEKVTLSRVLSMQEYELWMNGQFKNIKSRAFGDDISPRTTFALNYFEFNTLEPFIYEINKTKLAELNTRGELLINTYEYDMDPMYGMQAESRTNFGLEVELVVLNNSGRSMISEEMSRPKSVPKLIFPDLKSNPKLIYPDGLNKEQKQKWLHKKMMEIYKQELQKN